MAVPKRITPNRNMHRGDGVKITDPKVLEELRAIRDREGLGSTHTAIQRLLDGYYESNPKIERPSKGQLRRAARSVVRT